jgi:alpha-tubulin suppressor-like RCC1 family protein
VSKIEAGEFHCSALTSGGDLYSWGSAETHQIGVEGDYEFWEPVQAKFEIIQRGARGRLSIVAGMYEQRQILEVKGLKVVDFAIGHSLSCAVTEAGEVWMWGFSVETPTPQRVEGLKGNFIQRICAGSITNIIALTAPVKDLYVWDFQDTPEEKPSIKNDLYGRHLSMISAGKEHYAGVTTTGHLLLWGSNKEYQLALGMDSKIDYREVPEVIEMKWVIKDVQCGHEHTLALTEDGKVLSWGNGTMGQLGLRDRGTDAAFPTLVETIATKKIISIAVGAFNSG